MKGWLVALLLALAVARFGQVAYRGLTYSIGDFYSTLPGADVETFNPTLWNRRRASLGAQRVGGIDAAGAARGDIACQQRDHEYGRHGDDVARRVGAAYTVQH